MPAVDVAARIARLGGVSLEWLIGMSDDPGSATGLVELPLCEVRMSAGNGEIGFAEVPDTFLRISPQWVERLPRSRNLVVVEVAGDSMWPTLMDGDLVVVDRDACGRRHLVGGGVFVFTRGEDLYVKRCIIERDELVASSDNPEYETMRFDLAAEPPEIDIQGKVVWVAGPPRPFGRLLVPGASG